MRGVVVLACLSITGVAHAQEADIDTGVRAPQAGVAVDWTTGPTFGDVPTLGGAHGLGIEGRLAAFGVLELDGRYEMLAIALPADMGNAFSHQLLGQLKLRWITDDARHQLWAIGGGYGVAFRPSTLGGRTRLGRISLTRQIGMPKGPADLAVELAYERSLDDQRLDLVLGSIRFGLSSGGDSHYQGPKSPLFPHTTSFDLFAPGGLGMSFGLHASPAWSLETSGNFMAHVGVLTTDPSYHGFRGAQWAVQTGPRYQHDRWPAEWAPIYGLIQGGIGWLARDPGELRPVQTAEVGVRFICSDIGGDLGVWVRTDVEDGTVHAIAGGLALKIVLASDRIVIGGHNRKCADEESGGGTVAHETHTVSTSGSGGALPNVEVNGHVNVDVHGQLGGGGQQPQPQPPPPPRAEAVTARPGFVWIAGHWEWRGSWQWTAGHWERERPNMRWMPGTYEVRGSIYVWVEGHWSAR